MENILIDPRTFGSKEAHTSGPNGVTHPPPIMQQPLVGHSLPTMHHLPIMHPQPNDEDYCNDPNYPAN